MIRCYQLASCLGAAQPLYQVMQTELDGSRLPFPQYRELATQAIREIKGIQPEGPYFVAGHSAGCGNLALEIAYQLLDRGDDVDLLALFDFSLPGVVNSPSGGVNSLLNRVRYHVKQMEDLSLKDLVAYVSSRVAHAPKWLGPVRKAIYKVYQATGRQVPGFLQNAGWARNAALVHGVGFKRRSFPSRISVFRARDSEHVKEDLGWSEVATGGLEVHEVPGNHRSIFDEPNIEELSNRLRESLARARDDRHAGAASGSDASDTQR